MKNNILSKVLLYTKQGWPAEVSEAIPPSATRKSEITVEDDGLLWGFRAIIPNVYKQIFSANYTANILVCPR